jgi:hypothetical protein
LSASLVLVVSLSGGHAYRWCAPMQRAIAHCCCDLGGPPPTGPEASRACCEGRSVAELPAAPPQPAPERAPSAALAAIAVAPPRVVPEMARDVAPPRPLAFGVAGQAGPRRALDVVIGLRVLRC